MLPDRRLLVACDDDMMRFRPALEDAGFTVIPLHGAPLDRVAAVVLSGVDSDLLGDVRRLTSAPVVEARGLDARGVVATLQEKVRART